MSHHFGFYWLPKAKTVKQTPSILKCLGFRGAAETHWNQNVLTLACPHLPQINPIPFLVLTIEFLSRAEVVTAEVDHPTHCDEQGAEVSWLENTQQNHGFDSLRSTSINSPPNWQKSHSLGKAGTNSNHKLTLTMKQKPIKRNKTTESSRKGCSAWEMEGKDV